MKKHTLEIAPLKSRLEQLKSQRGVLAPPSQPHSERRYTRKKRRKAAQELRKEFNV